jgi:hypothetical protein
LLQAAGECRLGTSLQTPSPIQERIAREIGMKEWCEVCAPDANQQLQPNPSKLAVSLEWSGLEPARKWS